MSRYVIRRVILTLPTLFIVSALVFIIVRVMPGDVTNLLLQDVRYSRQDAEKLRERLGIDRPILVQYGDWIGSLARGDLGKSLMNQDPIARKVRQALPVTMELTLFALTFTMVVAIPIGTIVAVTQDRWPDYVVRGGAVLGASLPAFWIATVVLVIAGRYFGWSPDFEYHGLMDDPFGNLRQFLLPAFILGIATSASMLRLTRGMLLEVLRQDFIRTAYAKGLRQRTVVVRHALRNALMPVITVIGLQLANLLSGTLTIEIIFGLPGIGRVMIEAIQTRDYPTIQTVNLLVATSVVFINLVVDLTYGYLDPRTKVAA
ncbi:MAG: ABC transporter permease [Dehalococcoidia bacterium]|nr:ABC transporter permease [Dehalococcoidia bacterium]